MKKTVLLLACISLLAGCAGNKTQTYYPKEKGTFRIMSYNVGAMHKYIADMDENLNMIAAMINETQPDIVGLNELDSCNTRHNVNQIDLLTRRVGNWKWFYGKTIDYKGGAYGNGIITPKKTKVLNQYSHPFPNPTLTQERPHESRGVIVLETDKYVLLASHLDHSTEDYIMAQINDLNALVREKYKDSPIPVFFCGDMNAVPGSDAIKALKKDWKVISNQEEFTTVNSHRTIDFIFHYKYSAPVEVVGAHTLLKYYNGDSEKASDHFPIYVDVKLPDGKQKDFYPKANGTLRLVQYNVGSFSKEIDNSIPMIADMMKEIHADALSLNELDSCNTRHMNNQTADLAEAMGGWNYRFSRAMPYRDGAYGVGIAVPDEIQDHMTIALPKDTGSEPRACCAVETPRYVLASTHLDHRSEGAAVLQAQTITAALKAKYGDSDKPVFLAGDMNSRPDSKVLAELKKDWTVLSVEDNTYSAIHPKICIDYILRLNNKASIEVVGSGVPVKYTKGDVEIASDHLPVYLDVKIK